MGATDPVAGKDVILGMRDATHRLAEWLGCPGVF